MFESLSNLFEPQLELLPHNCATGVAVCVIKRKWQEQQNHAIVFMTSQTAREAQALM